MRLERKRVWLSSILKNENHYALLTSFGFSAYMLSEESIGVPGSDPLDGRQTMVAPLEALAPPVGVPRKSVGKDLVVRADGQLSRGLSIIECLSVFSSLTTEQLSVKTGIPKSSVYRILGILESFNYVSKSKVELEDVWSLDLKLLTLSANILGRVDLKTEIRDVLAKLADDTMEIVQLAKFQNDKVLIVDNIRKHNSIVSVAHEGTSLCINVCVAGLVFGAYMESEQLDSVLKNADLPRLTQYTITDPDELRQEFDRVRKNGYAVDDQYNAIGHRCIGAPVFDHTGTVVAEINISGHMRTISDDRIGELAAKVMRRAAQASQRMGYRPHIGKYMATPDGK